MSVVLIWKVRAYDEKYRELTKFEIEKFKAGDPESINKELGVDDQVRDFFIGFFKKLTSAF